MILLTIVMIAGCAICNAQIKQKSNTAANQAKEGKTSQAANTASKTWQNDRFEKTTPGSSNLHDYVSKKAEEARTAANQSSSTLKGGTTSGPSNSSTTTSSGSSSSGTSNNPSSDSKNTNGTATQGTKNK